MAETVAQGRGGEQLFVYKGKGAFTRVDETGHSASLDYRAANEMPRMRKGGFRSGCVVQTPQKAQKPPRHH